MALGGLDNSLVKFFDVGYEEWCNVEGVLYAEHDDNVDHM